MKSDRLIQQRSRSIRVRESAEDAPRQGAAKPAALPILLCSGLDASSVVLFVTYATKGVFPSVATFLSSGSSVKSAGNGSDVTTISDYVAGCAEYSEGGGFVVFGEEIAWKG
ncbi:hypothetical protein SH668x_000712 [Planctomicrobium sp. SH668]|uniref:hypothetical protein n=1 Tax=Planctomicrobium sp. SH668 TaxID=3448126 RepID=UPI003F5B3521